jgi:hypothetical protein
MQFKNPSAWGDSNVLTAGYAVILVDSREI